MSDPGEDTDRVTRIEAWLLDGRPGFELALPEIEKHVVPDVREKLQKKYWAVIQACEWDEIFNEAYYELDKMCEERRFEAKGDIGGLVYRLALWRVIARIRRIPKIQFDGDAKADDVPSSAVAKRDDFEVLDAIESYVAQLPESKRLILITAARLFIQEKLENLSDIRIDLLVDTVNKYVSPQLPREKIIRILNQEWAKLRAFFGREGF